MTQVLSGTCRGQRARLVIQTDRDPDEVRRQLLAMLASVWRDVEVTVIPERKEVTACK